MKTERFTVSYAKTNECFQFQFPDDRQIDRNSTLFGILCVLKNLFQRGRTLRPSLYLQEIFDIPIQKDLEPCMVLSKDVPVWDCVIKGGQRSNPALDFYKNIPDYFGNEFPFLQQLTIPEAYVSDIIPDSGSSFIGQQVDFYIPAAKIVIEIDGIQHQDTVQKQKDKNRDSHLKQNNIIVHRIPVSAFSEPEHNLLNRHINAIKSRLRQYKSVFTGIIEQKDIIFNPYIIERLHLDLVIRYELLIISMMQRGILDVKDSEWRFFLLGKSDNEKFFRIAMQDVMEWLRHLCYLAVIPFKKPEVFFCDDPKAVRIDCDLFKYPDGETSRNDNGIIIIRNEPYLDRDWFKLSLAEPIVYHVLLKRKDAVTHGILGFFLQNIFGYTKFRSGQLPIIAKALSRTDTIGILPTSGGKSLCYQLACLLQPCINFVICPLISLCHDQKYNLDGFGITRTAEITSNIANDIKQKAIRNLEKGKYFFVWITPERFQSADFRRDLFGNNKLRFCYAVLDEVHCLSEWGHDFRTAYLTLIRTIHRFIPETCLIGLTATISAFVLQDLIQEFGIDIADIIKPKKLYRPNLRFSVDLVPASKRMDTELFSLLDKIQQKYKNDSIFSSTSKNSFGGIIFCIYAQGKDDSTESVYQLLQEKYKGNIAVYHSKSESKDQIQLEFLENRIRLLIATKAFGMGVNKKNIRYTIHYGLPHSIEQFYQEAGRAGRDQNESQCTILYHQEPVINRGFIEKCFRSDTSAEDVYEYSKKFNFELKRIFYLLSQNFRGIKKDYRTTCEIYNILKSQDENNSFLKFINEDNTHAVSYPFEKIETEKALYRLMILGIVDDWTIDYTAQLMSLNWHHLSNDEIKNNFLNYIKRYDPEYKDFTSLSPAVRKPLKNKVLNQYCFIDALTIWQYENIYYQRRESIRHMMDLCEAYPSSPEKFQEEVCRFLTVNTVTDYLDNIAEKPWDRKSWFKILQIPRKNRENSTVKATYPQIMRSCERYLESYQALSGLDFVYSISCVMCNVITEEAQIRFQSAVSAFYDHFSAKEMREILGNLYPILKEADRNSRWWVREILIEKFPGSAEEIRAELGDKPEMPSGEMRYTDNSSPQLPGDNIWGTAALAPKR